MLRKLFALLLFLGLFPRTSLSQADSTNLPILIIDTHGATIVDEPKVRATLKIIYKPGEWSKPTDTANIYDGLAGVEIRGRFSATLPQKPFGIETRDEDGNNRNVSLFHMPTENDWILINSYNDKVFMRNTLAFELFRKMGHYAPRTIHCEVIVNGSYEGIYVFTERIKRDKGRVAIAKLNEDDNTGDNVTGGYIFKVDYYDGSNSWLSSFPAMGYPGSQVHFVYHYPKPRDITGPQKTYLRQYVHDFESALYAPPSSEKKKIRDLLDVDSFVDYFIVNELARNVDGYKKSAYFHKDRDSKDGKLYAGPVWDFDWAWKNIAECYFSATDGSGWAYMVHQCQNWPTPPTWMNRLLSDHEFASRVSARYFSLRQGILSNEYLFSYIDSVAAVLDDAQKRHYTRWPILGKNVGTPEVDTQPATFNGEIAKFKNWIDLRLRWLDANIPGLVVTGKMDEYSNAGLVYYPNPVKDRLYLSNETNWSEIKIYSPSGNLVLSQTNQRNIPNEIDVFSLPEGYYILRLITTDGLTHTGKIIKTR